MNGRPAIIWFLKAATVCAFVLAICWIAPHLIADIPDFPPITTEEEQFDITQRYFKLPVAKVALTGSSFTRRLHEEFFQNISVRNFSLPGGSPLTGAAVIEAADSIRPRFVAIETNMLARGIDQAMVDKFRMAGQGADPPPPMLKPFRAMAAAYQREDNRLKRVDTEDQDAMRGERAREEALLRRPPAPRNDAKFITAMLAEWNKPNDDAVIVKNAFQLKRLVDELEAKGVTVLLYELPIDPTLQRSRPMVRGRSALADAFGPDNRRWLSLEYPAEEIRWDDGAHLDDRSAIIVARSLERAISQKIQDEDCGACAVR